MAKTTKTAKTPASAKPATAPAASANPLVPTGAREANDETFAEILAQVQKDHQLVLLDFVAEWCGPCRMLKPSLDELATENPDVAIVTIDVDNARDTFGTYQGAAVPTLLLLRDGTPVKKFVGLQPKKNFSEAFAAARENKLPTCEFWVKKLERDAALKAQLAKQEQEQKEQAEKDAAADQGTSESAPSA